MPALAWPLATAPALTLLDIGGGAARGKDCLTESIAEGHRGNGEGRGERIFFVYNDIAVGFHQQKKQAAANSKNTQRPLPQLASPRRPL
jgi:hypothetical protein